MPRRGTPKATKRDWRWYASLALNGAVALSMVLGTIFLFTGAPTPRSNVPVQEVPTAVPTVAPNVATPVPTVAPPAPTPTPKASAQDYTFAVVGDSRDGDVVYKSVLRHVENDGSAFLIHFGDMVPNGKEASWLHFQELMKEFKLPFYPVIGNHETYYATPSDYLKYSGAPALHYSFDRGLVHFTFLDSHTGKLDDAELAYLENDLASTKQPVKLVFLHHPPFVTGEKSLVMHDSNERFMQIVAAHGVKYVFAGHLHCYEEAERNGVDYIITGGGGGPLSCPANAGGYYHYVQVTVHGESIKTQVVKIDGSQVVK